LERCSIRSWDGGGRSRSTTATVLGSVCPPTPDRVISDWPWSNQTPSLAMNVSPHLGGVNGRQHQNQTVGTVDIGIAQIEGELLPREGKPGVPVRIARVGARIPEPVACLGRYEPFDTLGQDMGQNVFCPAGYVGRFGARVQNRGVPRTGTAGSHCRCRWRTPPSSAAPGRCSGRTLMLEVCTGPRWSGN
jgi:hypothetical protein